MASEAPEVAAVRPSLEEFCELAGQFPAVTVCVTAADQGCGPVEAFGRISQDGRGFILEGKSYEEGAGRYAYVASAADCDALLTGPGTAEGDVDPVQALRQRLAGLCAPALPGLPEFFSGAVGYVAYEAIKHFEPSVQPLPEDPAGFPQSAFFLPRRFLAFDRQEKTVSAVVVVKTEGVEPETAYWRACEDAENLLGTALTPVRALLAAPVRHHSAASLRFSSGVTNGIGHDDWPDGQSGRSKQRPYGKGVGSQVYNVSQDAYESRVRRAREEIINGELIQVVLSQRIMRRTAASALDIYRQLRRLNPSTYMFMLNFGEFALTGASPELMVRSRSGVAAIHPIAGTRPRGETPEEDAALEAELLLNEKERAEHVMLVDLSRNDLGRVSQPGSVRVDSFMGIERYSHVMHLVSRVTGRLAHGTDGLDAFVAGFPIGTLSGAPRLRAIQLIAELEQEGRGPYCGGVGWFGANGDLDTGTVIRSIALKDGYAHVQGGGGIVYDSDPEREYRESLQKMEAPLQAIDMAETKANSCHAELDSASLVRPLLALQLDAAPKLEREIPDQVRNDKAISLTTHQ